MKKKKTNKKQPHVSRTQMLMSIICRQGRLPQLIKLNIKGNFRMVYSTDKLAKLKEHIEEVEAD